MNKEFVESLQVNNELNVAKDRQAFKDASVGTKLEKETTEALERETAFLEELIEQNEILQRKVGKAKASFVVLMSLTVLVVIARFLAFTQGF